MKRLTFLLLFLTLFVQLSKAQSPSNLTRTCLETLEGFLTVKQGEFQAERQLLPTNMTTYSSTNYNYLYVAKNEKSGRSNIFANGRLVIPFKYDVRAFRVGSSWNDCVSVFKYIDDELNEIGYGMETVYAYGVQQEKCDSVVCLSTDGYVYKLNDVYYYRPYNNVTTLEQPSPIVWLEKRVYKEADKAMLSSNGIPCKLSEGDVYYRSTGKGKENIHYYYLYRDNKYMPYTVLVIDGRLVELFGVYDEETFRLKYSYNGNHWMAVAGDHFWVDGEMKSVEGYTISDFLITNNGDYIYKAGKNGEEDKGETLIMNGEIIRRQVIIGHFALNAQQKLRFHFLAAGQWYVYDNGQISSVAKESNSVFYMDDLIDNLAVDKFSSDGMHKLSYVSGRAGVEIDGVRLTESVPFQVYFDKDNKCFKWNAIEVNKEGKTDLVVYTYSL